MIVNAAPLGRPLDGLAYRAGRDVNPGDVVKVPLGTRSVPACVLGKGETDRSEVKEISEVIAPGVFTPELLELAHRIAYEHMAFVGEVLGLILPSQILRPPRGGVGELDDNVSRKTLKMRADERKLLEAIDRSDRPVLICSSVDYTGLIVELVEETLEDEKECLILLPHEPAMARFYQRLKQYLPLAVYHADLGQGQRRRVWHGVRQGRLPVIAGMRSAALLPFSRLGLVIVIDEDSSSHRVRSHHIHYNARDIALHRGRFHNARTLLFTAASSAESYHQAGAGRMTLVERRFPQQGKALIVNLSKEPEGRLLSPPLFDELRSCKERRMQSVLVLNRLGTAGRLMCADCGNVLACPECGTTLKFMRPGEALVCPVCGKKIAPVERCPECGGANWKSLFPGLEILREELRGSLPHARLCEVTGEKRPDVTQVNQADIVYGSSAVLEYVPPLVQVAAFLSWDAERSRHDFRSAENAFRDVAYLRKMLASTPESRLVIQTHHPRNKLLMWALRGDYASFFASDIKRRKELGYPPYRRLLLFERRSSKAWDAARLEEALSREGVETLGPYQGRRNKPSILVKLRRDLSPGELMDAKTLLKSGWQVEVDPAEII